MVGFVRWIIVVPPVAREMQQDVHIKRIEAEGVLLFENDRGRRVAEHDGAGAAFGSGLER